MSNWPSGLRAYLCQLAPPPAVHTQEPSRSDKHLEQQCTSRTGKDEVVAALRGLPRDTPLLCPGQSSRLTFPTARSGLSPGKVCLLFVLSPLSFNFLLPASVARLREQCATLGRQAEALLCVQRDTGHLREPPGKSSRAVLPTVHSFLVAGVWGEVTPAVVSFWFLFRSGMGHPQAWDGTGAFLLSDGKLGSDRRGGSESALCIPVGGWHEPRPCQPLTTAAK